MARVTVEDCIEKVHDRFELVVLAAQRAKEIASGAPLTIDRNKEKNTVLGLREIAAGSVSVEDLRESLINSHQRVREMEEDLDDDINMQALPGAPLGESQNLIQEEAEPQEALAEAEDELGASEEISEPLDDDDIEEEAAPEVNEDSIPEDFSFEEDNLDIED